MTTKITFSPAIFQFDVRRTTVLNTIWRMGQLLARKDSPWMPDEFENYFFWCLSGMT